MAHYKLTYAPVVQEAFLETEKNATMLGCSTVQQLNNKILAGDATGIILVSEAFQERRIAAVVDKIANHPETKIILIAGPSSSGKTSFTQRLRVQLATQGIMTVSLSMDNYFVDREFTPRRPDGSLDFDAPEAMDMDLFNGQIDMLSQGWEVDIPRFDFITGKKVFGTNKIKLAKNQVILVEGIHALNKKLVHFADERRILRVYITVLNPLDGNNGENVNPSHVRLIRRIVRDNQYRNFDARATIKQWPLVRDAETKYIYNTANHADFILNTSLIYELNVLKPYALPLLESIRNLPGEEGKLVNELIELLNEFVIMPYDDVPMNSIMREFIGGSSFKKYL